MDVVGLLLVDPEHLVHGTPEGRAAQRESGKLLSQVIAVAYAKLLDGVGGRAVLPVRADPLTLGRRAALDDVRAHPDKDVIGSAHAVASVRRVVEGACGRIRGGGSHGKAGI